MRLDLGLPRVPLKEFNDGLALSSHRGLAAFEIIVNVAFSTSLATALPFLLLAQLGWRG